MAPETTRFAPSPTGHLHLGHAFAALFAAEIAHDSGGRFLVRMEDTDRVRSKASYEADILEDLNWLGLSWETPVRRQSEHEADYLAALDRLRALGCVYPCFCTRKDIAAEVQQAAGAPQGPDGPLYGGHCRGLGAAERTARMQGGESFAWRLDIERASVIDRRDLWFEETGEGPGGARGRIPVTPSIHGDVVLAVQGVCRDHRDVVGQPAQVIGRPVSAAPACVHQAAQRLLRRVDQRQDVELCLRLVVSGSRAALFSDAQYVVGRCVAHETKDACRLVSVRPVDALRCALDARHGIGSGRTPELLASQLHAGVDGTESDGDANRGLPCSKRLQRCSVDACDRTPLASRQLGHLVGSYQTSRINMHRPLSAEVSAAYGAAGVWV